jgi:glycosyltransferase involved in cell wall biosynthesis
MTQRASLTVPRSAANMANFAPSRAGGSSVPSLSVFLPMYNERENIVPAVEALLPVLQCLTDDFEVIIVDDGSTDGSSELADGLARDHAPVQVVRHEENLGYGASLATGYRVAQKDRVFYTDSDVPIHYAEIGRAWELLNTDDVDAVIGYRLNPERGPHRRLYTAIYHFLMGVLFGVKVKDVNFSCKMVTRAARDCLGLSAKTVFVDGQLLHQLRRHGFKLREMGVEYLLRQRGSSSFNTLGPAVETFGEMLSYWWGTVRRGVVK